MIGNLKVIEALERNAIYLSALHLYSVLILFVLSQRKAVLCFGVIWMYERYFITLQKVTNLKWRMNIILPAGKIINRAVGIVHVIFI